MPEQADPHNEAQPEGGAMPSGGVYDDAALRETIARLLAEDGVEARNDSERDDRIQAVKQLLKDAGYVNDDVIKGVVDRLIEKWRL